MYRSGEIPPLHLEVHLVNDLAILGEPIVLRYKLTNTSEQEITVHMGRNKDDWITMRLESSSGTLVPPRLDPRLRQGGIYTTGVRISARSSSAGYVVISQRFLVSETGTHNLLLDVRAPYDAYSQAMRTNSSSGGEPAEKSTLTGIYTFPLTVIEAQPGRLKIIAEELWEAAAQAGSRERMMSLEALFAMPEGYVSDIWRAAASDPRLLYDRSFIADLLERLSTIAAADILWEMVLNTPADIAGQPASDGTKSPITLSFSVHQQFHNLYFHADPHLKAHLAKIYIERGLAVPDRPIIVID